MLFDAVKVKFEMPHNVGNDVNIHCVKSVRIWSYSGPNAGKYRLE